MWAGLALISSNVGVAVTQLALLLSSLPSPDWLNPSLVLARREPNCAASGWHLGCRCRWALGKQDEEILMITTLTQLVKTSKSSWNYVGNYLSQHGSGTDYAAVLKCYLTAQSTSQGSHQNWLLFLTGKLFVKLQKCSFPSRDQGLS